MPGYHCVNSFSENSLKIFLCLCHLLITTTPTAQTKKILIILTSRLWLTESSENLRRFCFQLLRRVLLELYRIRFTVYKPEDEMRRACGTHGTEETFCGVLAGKPEGKGWVERPRRRWEEKFKMNLKPIRWKSLAWIHLHHDRDKGTTESGTCRGSGLVWSSASHSGDLSSDSDQPIWDLWWTK